MKPITSKFASLLWKEQKQDPLVPFRKPAPFPGKYPTRVYMRVGKWKYVGKPSVNVYRTFQSLIPKCPYDYTSIEFDRKSVLYGSRRAGLGGRSTQIYHEALWAVYHPQSIANYALSWMGYGVRTLRHWYVIVAQGIKGVR